ncbi:MULTISPECIES: energy transducer TonB [Reichenbachiella]|uniref:Outer membrane transport energization protein TonB (TC 2.C.1.1.1) n=1 Tax=Reichenbachiella agariperforans TaxID=156994 RepID=A0A1M6TQY6_REIAG|nr:MULTISPECIES: energy transducer TonB [Reichenbachiella]MBU2915535.1 energy transducer TonB [Reichenbachiella agariperforans]RJE71401.1 energy transducer TonB [Reichenbachiella sp. MSK19-1]SHK59309.1 outer membrane transport energization protein TonB (TC 2.C.1.1.1) [Reichenbachiella agariperforans]
MELKKNPKISLERKAGMFFNIGLAVSLLLITTAFEWKFYDEGELVDLGQIDDDFEDIMEIPPTEQPPPPPPKIELPKIIEVPDEEEIEEEIEVELDVEITEETVIEDIVFEEEPEEEVADEIFDIVEDQPAPPGGMAAFYKYVGKSMKYPNQARRMGVEGRVFVQFVVDKDGSITEVRAIKGIGAGCDEEAVRVLQGAPKWKPGKQRGRAVKVRMILPITFKLS